MRRGCSPGIMCLGSSQEAAVWPQELPCPEPGGPRPLPLCARPERPTSAAQRARGGLPGSASVRAQDSLPALCRLAPRGRVQHSAALSPCFRTCQGLGAFPAPNMPFTGLSWVEARRAGDTHRCGPGQPRQSLPRHPLPSSSTLAPLPSLGERPGSDGDPEPALLCESLALTLLK